MKKKSSRINGVKQEFEILSFDKEFKNVKLSDNKGKSLDAIYIGSTENWDFSKIKRGLRISVIASKRKVRSMGGR